MKHFISSFQDSELFLKSYLTEVWRKPLLESSIDALAELGESVEGRGRAVDKSLLGGDWFSEFIFLRK